MCKFAFWAYSCGGVMILGGIPAKTMAIGNMLLNIDCLLNADSNSNGSQGFVVGKALRTVHMTLCRCQMGISVIGTMHTPLFRSDGRL